MDIKTKVDLLKIGVLTNKFPAYLYKFRSIETLNKILDNNGLWFARPSSFNDPFDCQIEIDTNNTFEEIINYFFSLREYKIDGYQKLTNDLIEVRAKEYYENPEKFKQFINGIMSASLNNLGVCCFVKEPPLNILMWSHYANSHQGVCLKFSVLNDLEFFTTPIPINYQKEYPLFNYLKDGKDKLASAMIGTKSKDWEYESELRVIKDNFGLHKFKKKALVEIIFGCDSERDEINKITEKLNELKYLNVKISYMKKKKNEFGLEISDFL